jgi:hypothetical protein
VTQHYHIQYYHCTLKYTANDSRMRADNLVYLTTALSLRCLTVVLKMKEFQETQSLPFDVKMTYT